MDPISLATAAVALLAPFMREAATKLAGGVGERAAGAAVELSRELYERVRTRLSGDPYNEQQLAGVQADPDSPVRRRNLEATLAELFAQDRKFADEVARLVGQTQPTPGASIEARETGVTSTGGVTMTAGRDAVGRDKIGGDPPSGVPGD